MKMNLALSILLISVVTLSRGQNVQTDPFSIARNALGNNANYLNASNKLKEVENDCLQKATLKKTYLQAALTFNAFLLNNPSTKRLTTLMLGESDPEALPLFLDNESENAIGELMKKISNEQVVMFNEIHIYSKERFAFNLFLKPFREKGFKYLAMEAIWEERDSLNMRRFPVVSTGLYTLDPRMANFIRDALEMGFILIGYDHFGKDREYNQALNLYNNTIKDDPDAKLLVYTGGSHANKCDKDKMMGFHFREISGIDPFVIRNIKHDEIQKAGYAKLAIEPVTDEKRCSYDLFLINILQENDFLFRPLFPQIEVVLKDFLDNDVFAGSTDNEFFLSLYLKKEFDAYALGAIPVVSYIVNENLWENPVRLPVDEYILTIRNVEGNIVFQKEVIVL